MRLRQCASVLAGAAETPRLLLRHGLLAAACLLAGGFGEVRAVEVKVTDSAGSPLANAVVYQMAADESRVASPADPVRIDQLGKRFVPLVTVVQVGSAVLFPNSDNIRHHVYSFSPAKRFELKLYHGIPADPVVFDQPGTVTLGCNIHDSMIAYVRVLDTPHFAMTAEDGVASLDVEPAAGPLYVWHPFQKGEDTELLPDGQARMAARVTIDTAVKAQVEAVIR